MSPGVARSSYNLPVPHWEEGRYKPLTPDKLDASPVFKGVFAAKAFAL